MSLLASLAITDQVDCLGTALHVSKSHIVIELEDGSLHCFDAYGRPVETLGSQHGEAFSRRFKAFSLIGDKLIVADAQFGAINIMTISDTTKTSIKVSEQPKKIIPYYDSQSEHVIVSADLAHAQLLSLPTGRAFGMPTPEVIMATSNIPPYKIFNYHITQSALALLCARGIVQLWHLPSLTNSDGRFEEMCTICSTEALPPLPSGTDTRERSEEVYATEIFSVLVHSTNRVLTGHGDGKIKVWDIGMISAQSTIPRNDHGQKLLTKPSYVVMKSESSYLINNLLEYSQAGINKPSVVSSDTGGFVKLWRFQDDSSNDKFKLSLVGQHKLFEKSVLRGAITTGGWFVAGGKEGGDQDSCGLIAQVRALRLATLNDDGSPSEVKDLGGPSLAVWDIKTVNLEGFQHLAISLMRRGRAWLEVWNTSLL